MDVCRIIPLLLVLLILTQVDSHSEVYEENLTREQFIAAVNLRATTWTAGINPGPEPVFMSIEGHASPAELRMFDSDPLLTRNDTVDLPETFDARDHWPECPSLRNIRNQGCCASCYAVAVAAAITDRWCIHSNGMEHFTFSSQDSSSCCTSCGNCHGGFQHRVWWHWRQHGFVSGGERDSEEGCRPYEVGACVNGGPEFTELECVESCREGHSGQYDEDKRYGARVYRVSPDEEMIMRNIYVNGPVTSRFRVFSDLSSYQTGVYKHVYGRDRGFHVIKLIGWGVENGTNYWLVANSWGSSWGDNGFFKILRGENHLGIESEVFGGIPSYD